MDANLVSFPRKGDPSAKIERSLRIVKALLTSSANLSVIIKRRNTTLAKAEIPDALKTTLRNLLM